MKIVRTINDIKAELSEISDRSIGFVPTMGYLHEGHISLIKKSLLESDIVVVSIFVNPIQFGVGEDLDKYPRDIERDSEILENLGVDFLFSPVKDEVYPTGFLTSVNVNKLDNLLCGKSRPGHFTGVATIVLKLLNIIDPEVVYFGKKDAQQLIILKRMVRDLNLDVEIKSIDIVRDENGLALSSRNSYLSDIGKKSALVLSGALKLARGEIMEMNVCDPEAIKRKITDFIKKEKKIKIDYIEIVSLTDLTNIKKIDKNNTLIACAIFIENIRLIDNLIMGEL